MQLQAESPEASHKSHGTQLDRYDSELLVSEREVSHQEHPAFLVRTSTLWLYQKSRI